MGPSTFGNTMVRSGCAFVDIVHKSRRCASLETVSGSHQAPTIPTLLFGMYVTVLSSLHVLFGASVGVACEQGRCVSLMLASLHVWLTHVVAHGVQVVAEAGVVRLHGHTGPITSICELTRYDMCNQFVYSLSLSHACS